MLFAGGKPGRDTSEMTGRQHNTERAFILCNDFNVTDLNEEQGAVHAKALFNGDRVNCSRVIIQRLTQIWVKGETLVHQSMHFCPIHGSWRPFLENARVRGGELVIGGESGLFCDGLAHDLMFPMGSGVKEYDGLSSLLTHQLRW